VADPKNTLEVPELSFILIEAYSPKKIKGISENTLNF